LEKMGRCKMGRKVSGSNHMREKMAAAMLTGKLSPKVLAAIAVQLELRRL
jgi:hypothetical protein